MPLLGSVLWSVHVTCEAYENIQHHRTEVLYMCSSFWLLGVESLDFSHAEKERTACKA